MDYGRRRIGLALSDEGGVLASPYPPYHRTYSKKKDLSALARFCRDHDVGHIVLGLPLNMDGSAGPMVEEVLAFAEELKQRTRLTIDMLDERQTSREAERVLVEGDVSRKKRKQLRDSLSAVLILQGYLDRQASDGNPSPAL